MSYFLWYHTLNTHFNAWWIAPDVYTAQESICTKSEYFQRLMQLPETAFQRELLQYPLPDSKYWQRSRFFSVYAAKHYLDQHPLAELVHVRQALGPLWLWHVRTDPADMQWWMAQTDLSHPLFHWLVLASVPKQDSNEPLLQILSSEVIIDTTKRLWTPKARLNKEHSTQWWMGHIPLVYAKYPELLTQPKHQHLLYCSYRMLHSKAPIFHPTYPTYGDAVAALLHATNKKRLRDLLQDVRTNVHDFYGSRIWDTFQQVKAGLPWITRLQSQGNESAAMDKAA